MQDSRIMKYGKKIQPGKLKYKSKVSKCMGKTEIFGQ